LINRFSQAANSFQTSIARSQARRAALQKTMAGAGEHTRLGPTQTELLLRGVTENGGSGFTPRSIRAIAGLTRSYTEPKPKRAAPRYSTPSE